MTSKYNSFTEEADILPVVPSINQRQTVICPNSKAYQIQEALDWQKPNQTQKGDVSSSNIQYTW